MQRDYNAFVTEFCMKLEKNETFIRRGVTLLDDARSAVDSGRLQIAWGEDRGITHVYSVRTEDLYDKYRRGRRTEEIADDLLDEFLNVDPDELNDVARQINDYEQIRSRLFIRAINYDKDKDQLEHCVYRRTGDIAQTLYVRAGARGDTVTSGKIPKSMIERWGRKEAEVFDAALLNTFFMTPPRLYKWEEMLSDPSYKGENFMGMMKTGVLSKGPEGNCISTTEQTNGAVAAFMPGVLPRIADLLESDLYLAFTSIHEVMVHSADSVSPDQIRKVLESTIDECTDDEEFLSKNVFFYDRHEGHVICLAGN